MVKSARIRKDQPARRMRALPELPPRPRDAHKGSFGRVLVLGGSRGMIGAPALAANAALRSGAGLATVACPRTIQLAVATLCPCATSIPLAETPAGLLDPKRVQRELRALGLLSREGAPSVVAAGPGLGRGDAAFDRAWLALLQAFGAARVSIVLDADGLNALHKSAARPEPRPPTKSHGLQAVWSFDNRGAAARLESRPPALDDWGGPGWDSTPHYRTVITPHPGEMARLHGTTTAAVQADREAYAVRTARQMAAAASEPRLQRRGRESEPRLQRRGRRDDPDYQPVVVLKGAGSIVTDGARLYVNGTGNPGMATGGSGDVLTGVIAALIAQGLSCFDAAVLGVHLHGLAGDLAARQLGEESLTAADLIDFLPDAFTQQRKK